MDAICDDVVDIIVDSSDRADVEDVVGVCDVDGVDDDVVVSLG